MDKKIYLSHCFVLLCIAVFICLASLHINMPGIYYDEITFANAALGGIEDNFIYQRILGVPVMIMPYIGALKSWMYYPLFKVFGVSAATIRLPMILLSGCSLWLWYEIGKKIFPNRWCSVLLVAILATDPAFIFQSKLDWGPIVIQIFLMSLILYCFFKMIAEKSTELLLAISGFLLLGIYNKLNFIWFALAFGISALMFYSKKILQLYKEHKSDFIFSCLTFCILLFLALLFLIIPAYQLPIGSSIINYNDRFYQIFALYKMTMNGSTVYSYVIGKELLHASWVNHFSAIIFILWLPTLIIQKYKKDYFIQSINKYILFFLTIFILIFLQIVFTKQSGGPHHIMMLWPLHLVILFLMLCAIAQTITSSAWLKGLLIIIPAGALITSQLTADISYENAFSSNDFSYKWSPQIYQLADYTNKNSSQVSYILSADWGTWNQLFAFAPNNTERMKYVDFWPWFTDLNKRPASEMGWFYKTFFQNKKTFVILFPKNYQIIPNVRDNFFWFAKKYLKSYKLITVIKDEQNNPLYEIYLTEG